MNFSKQANTGWPIFALFWRMWDQESPHTLAVLQFILSFGESNQPRLGNPTRLKESFQALPASIYQLFDSFHRLIQLDWKQFFENGLLTFQLRLEL